MKKVSVIVATYNGQLVIEGTLRSILFQEGVGDLFVLEVIVVDDCSTDATVAIVQSLGISAYTTERNSGGPNRGRNIGLDHATGDYICIADQDDVWESKRIRSLLPLLLNTPIVSSGYTIVDRLTNKKVDKTKRLASVQSAIHYPSNRTFLDRLSKAAGGQNTYLGAIVYSSALKHIRFEEHFGMVDFDWILRLFHQQESVELAESLYTRLVDGSNLSLNEAYRAKDFYYTLLTLEGYEATYPKEVQKAYRRVHGSRARYYYLIGKMAKARFYFLRAGWTPKNVLYYLTTFAGANYVKRKFNVFG